MIRAVGVVIPAHDEEDLLPGCLSAVRRAGRLLAGIPLHTVVVADACTDRTADVARAARATAVEITARNVGAARAAGAREVLRRTGHLPPGAVWLATTDADTLVPPRWLDQQVRYAAAGWDAVVGTVGVRDWSGYPPGTKALFEQGYRRATHGRGGHRAADGHPHVHGANLAFTAEAYLSAGGFEPRPAGEDHALVRSLAAARRRILRTPDLEVVTSARRHARAPHGFSDFLRALAARTA